MISHQQLAHWYLQLAQQIEAGMTLPEALAQSGGPPVEDRIALAEKLTSQASADGTMMAAPSWIPRADRLLIATSLQTGRLDQTFNTLSKRHERIGATQYKAILGLIYPVAVFHIAAIILPVVEMIDYEKGFEWSFGAHALHSTTLIIPLWVVITVIALLAKIDSPHLHRLLRGLPLLRRYSKRQALANFAHTLGTLTEAGVPIQTAWKHSAELSYDSQIRRAYANIEQVIDRGQDPSQSLKDFPVFPAGFSALYISGARSGKLDRNLIQAGENYQVEANRAMTFAAIVYPVMLLAVVAAFMIYNIFKVYGGYVDTLLEFSQ